MANNSENDNEGGITKKEVYTVLADLINSAEQGRWAKLYTLLVLDTIFIVAWCTVFTAKDPGVARTLALLLLSIPGALLSLLWGALGKRSSDYLDDFHKLAERMEDEVQPTWLRPFQTAEKRRKEIRESKSRWQRYSSSMWLVTRIPQWVAAILGCFAAVTLIDFVLFVVFGANKNMFGDTNWNAVSAIATFLAVVVALTAMILPPCLQWWKRPKLTIEFDNNQDVCSQQNTVNPGIPANSRWLRVRVVNGKGREPAKNCRAYLNRVERVMDGNRTQTCLNDNRPMVWMHDSTECPSARDLLPEVVHRIDVAFTQDTVLAINAHVAPAWRDSTPGVYDFKIQVSGENTNSTVITVRVHWDGRWDSLQGEQRPVG